MEKLASAFAVTAGRDHQLVYANTALRSLIETNGGDAPDGAGSILDALDERHVPELKTVLDRAFRTGVICRNRRVERLDSAGAPLVCTVWPELTGNGETEGLVIELRVATSSELTFAIQREVAEQLLLTALRQHDVAEIAEIARRDSHFLAAESSRLGESLDVEATLVAMEHMSLPAPGSWCVVDVFADDHTLHRLAVVHPDPAKEGLIADLESQWAPLPDDTYGLPAILRKPQLHLVVNEVDAAVLGTARDDAVTRLLTSIGIRSMLTVPLISGDRLTGAVTFMNSSPKRFTDTDIRLAQELAARSAAALERARAFAQVTALKSQAEAANDAKSDFLGMMSHELRTPLNAIGGYAELIELEIHGPVTAAQRVDLGRIRGNQRYLMGLIDDLLTITKVGGGKLPYVIKDLGAHDVLAATIAVMEPLIVERELRYELVKCDPAIVARGDRDKVLQILINVLTNATKFSRPGGSVTLECQTDAEKVHLRVSDTGIGIPTEKLSVIFDPFVQVATGNTMREGGVGLGLAISRGLARGMQGDLTVESTLGEGACFTLTLPRATAPA